MGAQQHITPTVPRPPPHIAGLRPFPLRWLEHPPDAVGGLDFPQPGRHASPQCRRSFVRGAKAHRSPIWLRVRRVFSFAPCGSNPELTLVGRERSTFHDVRTALLLVPVIEVTNVSAHAEIEYS